MDAVTEIILTAIIARRDAGESLQMERCPVMVDEEIASVTTDGSYDGTPA
jgi:hypothetical protein